MSSGKALSIIECPRDAMQGIGTFIPTEKKITWLNLLLQAGFETLDCGSFVSPKAIPQMADTPFVLPKLARENSRTKTSVIVANLRGAEDAVRFKEVDIFGYPFSVSETFQLRNTNASIAESVERVKSIYETTKVADKTLLIYLSMAFGNPYGDHWSPERVSGWVSELYSLGIRHFSLADTVGVAKPEDIHQLFSALLSAWPEACFSAHFHTRPNDWQEKVEAAWSAGCNRFESAIKGFGGCPMAADSLTGNLPTENLLAFAEKKGIPTTINPGIFEKALQVAGEVFP